MVIQNKKLRISNQQRTPLNSLINLNNFRTTTQNFPTTITTTNFRASPTRSSQSLKEDLEIHFEYPSPQSSQSAPQNGPVPKHWNFLQPLQASSQFDFIND